MLAAGVAVASGVADSSLSCLLAVHDSILPNRFLSGTSLEHLPRLLDGASAPAVVLAEPPVRVGRVIRVEPVDCCGDHRLGLLGCHFVELEAVLQDDEEPDRAVPEPVGQAVDRVDQQLDNTSELNL